MYILKRENIYPTCISSNFHNLLTFLLTPTPNPYPFKKIQPFKKYAGYTCWIYDKYAGYTCWIYINPKKIRFY